MKKIHSDLTLIKSEEEIIKNFENKMKLEKQKVIDLKMDIMFLSGIEKTPQEEEVLKNLEKKLIEMNNGIEKISHEINLSVRMNENRKQKVTEEKISSLNRYVLKIKKQYQRFNGVNKFLHFKKMQEIKSDEVKMEF